MCTKEQRSISPQSRTLPPSIVQQIVRRKSGVGLSDGASSLTIWQHESMSATCQQDPAKVTLGTGLGQGGRAGRGCLLCLFKEWDQRYCCMFSFLPWREAVLGSAQPQGLVFTRWCVAGSRACRGKAEPAAHAEWGGASPRDRGGRAGPGKKEREAPPPGKFQGGKGHRSCGTAEGHLVGNALMLAGLCVCLERGSHGFCEAATCVGWGQASFARGPTELLAQEQPPSRLCLLS